MNAQALPSEDNHYLAEHVALLRDSFYYWLGRDLLPYRMTDTEAARYLFHARWAVVSHNADKAPVFNYGNRTALSLFGMAWEEMMACPLRLSFERGNDDLPMCGLSEVSDRGYVEDYRGVRIGRHGRRFEIDAAILWNLRDAVGKHCGQAASFKHWKWL